MRALPADFDRLTRGAIDLHVHGQPDLARSLANRGDDAATARLAVTYGVRAWVLKSHVWPTTDRAAALQSRMDPARFRAFGSVTLNPPTGGISAASVDLAAAHGARMVFLPTWSAAADVARGGYISRLLGGIVSDFARYESSTALSVLADERRLTAAARDVVAACAEHDLTLGTGHLSLDESRAVAAEAATRGVRVIVNHPLHYAPGPEVLRELAGTGAFIEFSGGPLLHPDATMTVRDVHTALAEVGPEQVVLTSDAFSRWAPAQPEALRIFLEQLSYLGTSRADLARMTAANPARALGLEPTAESGSEPAPPSERIDR